MSIPAKYLESFQTLMRSPSCSAEVYFYRYINNNDTKVRTYSSRFVLTKKFKTQGVEVATTVGSDQPAPDWRQD